MLVTIPRELSVTCTYAQKAPADAEAQNISRPAERRQLPRFLMPHSLREGFVLEGILGCRSGVQRAPFHCTSKVR